MVENAGEESARIEAAARSEEHSQICEFAVTNHGLSQPRAHSHRHEPITMVAANLITQSRHSMGTEQCRF